MMEAATRLKLALAQRTLHAAGYYVRKSAPA